MKFEPSPEGSEIIDALAPDAFKAEVGQLEAKQEEGGPATAQKDVVGFHFGYIAVGPSQGGYQVAVALGEYRTWASGVHATYHQACNAALNAYKVPPRPDHDAGEIHMLVNAMVARGWEPLGMNTSPDEWTYFPLRRRA